MSVVLSASQLCKHVLKIGLDVFANNKRKGNYKKQVASITTKVWDNLAKLFPTSEKIVKENVTEKDMHGAVRSLLTGKNTDSVILYKFTENRKTREGKN